MFTANLPTQDYRLDAIFYALETATYGATASDQGCVFNAYSQTTYGLAYNPGTHGFKISFTTQRIPGGASSYSIDFESPWWSGNLANSATLILNNATVTLEFDDVDHACGCDAWALEFSELRIYLDAVLAHTVTAQSDSGTGYDPRDDDTVEYESISPYIGIDWGRPSCGGYSNRITNAYQVNLQGHIDGIWDRSPVASPGWIEDGVGVAGYTPGGLGCISCGTTDSGPTNLSGGAVTVSKHIRAARWYQDALIYNDYSDILCECLPSHTTNSEWHYWSMQRQLDWLQPITARFIPDASPIRKHTWREQEACLSSAGNSTYDSGVVSVTDSSGVSIWDGSRFKGDWKRYCVEQFVGPIPCFVGETRSCTPFDPTNSANIPPDVYCYFTVTVVMTWPTKPPCGAVIFSVEVSDGWRHYMAKVDPFRALFIERASNSLDDWTTVDLSTSCDDVDIALDKTGSSQTLFYVLDVAGTIKLYTAPAEGNTLTLSATIGSGSSPSAVSNAGLLFIYRVSGTTVVGQILDVAGNVVKTDFTAIATIDASSRIDVKWSASGGGSRRIELYCIVAGVVTQYTSPDGITFS